MGQWQHRRVAWIFGLLTVTTIAAPLQAQSPQAAVAGPDPALVADGETAEIAAEVPHFALFADFGKGHSEFTLFKDSSLAGWDGPMGRLELHFRQEAVPGPQLVGLPTMVLGLSFRGEPDPKGGRRIVIGPISREWSDLDPWEKFGVALSYAGAAAAAVHFAAEIARALDR